MGSREKAGFGCHLLILQKKGGGGHEYMRSDSDNDSIRSVHNDTRRTKAFIPWANVFKHRLCPTCIQYTCKGFLWRIFI